MTIVTSVNQAKDGNMQTKIKEDFIEATLNDQQAKAQRLREIRRIPIEIQTVDQLLARYAVHLQ